jgi:DNA polymerase alpha subunit A
VPIGATSAEPSTQYVKQRSIAVKSRFKANVKLLAIIQRFDPDVIVGHEFSTVMLDVILHRLRDLKADHYSRIGRFRRLKWPNLKAGMNTGLLSGRLICDLASDGSKVCPALQSSRYSLP